MNIINQYLKDCYEMQERYPSWRWGQTLFNTLHMHNPAMANEIRGTDLDPYYSAPDDATEHAFWEWLAANLEE